MSAKTTESKLEQAIKLLNSVLDSIRAESQPEDAVAVDTCWWCGEPIYEGDPTTRKAHKRCYFQWWRANVGEGKTYATTEEAFEAGALPAKEKPGRKQLDLSKHTEDAKKRIAKRHKK